MVNLLHLVAVPRGLAFPLMNLSLSNLFKNNMHTIISFWSHSHGMPTEYKTAKIEKWLTWRLKITSANRNFNAWSNLTWNKGLVHLFRKNLPAHNSPSSSWIKLDHGNLPRFKSSDVHMGKAVCSIAMATLSLYCSMILYNSSFWLATFSLKCLRFLLVSM